MNKLPALSARQIIRIFKRAGFEVKRQSGSHIVMIKKVPRYCEIVIPNHKILKTGLVHALIKHSGLSKEEFKNLL